MSDEETYEAHLGKLLEVNGQKALDGILETHKRPFALIPKENETSAIAQVVAIFKAEVINNIDTYFSAWIEHVKHPEFHYSRPMREVLIKDLQNQSSALSIDGSSSLFTEISVLLHEFDSISHASVAEATTSALLPQLQAWFSQKYSFNTTINSIELDSFTAR